MRCRMPSAETNSVVRTSAEQPRKPRAASTVPNGESSMWGDYHARELGVMLWREAESKAWHHFHIEPWGGRDA